VSARVTVLERELGSVEDDIVVFVTWSSDDADVVRLAPGEVLQVAGRVAGEPRIGSVSQERLTEAQKQGSSNKYYAK
jgi:hypothetical protein